MRNWFVFCAVVGLGSACSGNAPEAPAVDMADPCAPLGRSENGVCVSQLAFTAAPSLPKARDHHGTAIAETAQGAYLYVTGGTNYAGVFRDAQVARIAEDGSLGAFAATTMMMTGRAGHGTVARSGRLYVVGGQSSGSFLASVDSVPVNADGTLGAWDAEPPLPEGRFHVGVTMSDTHLYAVGGVRSDDPSMLPYEATKTVSFATFLPDGHLGPWQAGPELPEPRSHHAIYVHGGSMYVVGGLIKDTSNGGPMAHDVLVSKLGADGTPGPFVAGGSFDEPVSTLALFDQQGYLYAVGGLTEDDSYSARIRRAPFLADATLGAFTDVGELPSARSHVHQTPYRHGALYSMGGSIDYNIVTDEVWVGRFSPPAPDAPLAAKRHVRSAAPARGDSVRCPCNKQRISIPK